MNKVETIIVPKNKGHFQGELYIGPSERMPNVETVEAAPVDGKIIVGHSETGHHHVVDSFDTKLLETKDPLVCYLVAEGAYTDLVHMRDFHTHPTLRIENEPGKARKVIRQREMAPTGWVKAAD